jgi:bacillithiol biosynthesis cysteine-adding enzyme BshC
MKVHHIPFQKTGYFSKIICDYLDRNNKLSDFYENFPEIDGLRRQIELKRASFKSQSRNILVTALKNQSKSTNTSDFTLKNINLLEKDTTFTVTTGHQLNIFTGPLYFLYKIVTAINLAEKLKREFPLYNFVPVYWMATEDHDFDEINFFNFKGSKIKWDREASGGVGRLKTNGIATVFSEFSELLGDSGNAQYLNELFQKSYAAQSNLADATRYLVNELFGNYGLVIVDGDDTDLKQQFSSIVKDELLNNTSFKEISRTIEYLQTDYKVQVNPREINLFYLKDDIRERIIYENDAYLIKNTDIIFSKNEIIEELRKYPDRFSPNVVMRPVYQEVILPNLCYIGGGGELAYWFQLKRYFAQIQIPFPVLLLRSSVLLMTPKQAKKLDKLNISLEEIFKDQSALINKKVKEISEIEIDFSSQRKYLMDQFNDLKEMALQTDASFLGAVLAQEKKQLNGLDKLEKRLLKAQKRKLHDIVQRITLIQNELFPNHSLEERTRNMSEIYMELGNDFIPMLKDAIDPLILKFSIIETH